MSLSLYPEITVAAGRLLYIGLIRWAAVNFRIESKLRAERASSDAVAHE